MPANRRSFETPRVRRCQENRREPEREPCAAGAGGRVAGSPLDLGESCEDRISPQKDRSADTLLVALSGVVGRVGAPPDTIGSCPVQTPTAQARTVSSATNTWERRLRTASRFRSSKRVLPHCLPSSTTAEGKLNQCEMVSQ